MPARKRIDWRGVAARLGADVPRDSLHPAVVAWTARSRRRQNWAVAVSGGADSLALLLLVWWHWPERRKNLCALHFNHRLRGPAADRDEAHGREVCAALRIKWRAGHWREAHPDASEGEARRARHDFFSAQMRRAHSRILWLGHQRDDVIETMLMRLARGSGTGGLAAPRPVQRLPKGRVHLRPLLTLSKEQIVAVLRRAGAAWREDASNAGARFLRNRIRRDVVPVWRAASPERDAFAGAALSRELLEEDDAALEAWVDILDPIAEGGALNLARVAGKPRAVVRRALHRWLAWHRRGEGLSRQAFEAILNDLVAGRTTRHSIGREAFAVLGARRLTLAQGP